MPTEGFEHLLREIKPQGRLAGWMPLRIAAWAAVAGLDVSYDEPMTPAHAAMLRRDWQGAADAFGAAGWYYDRALMLSLTDDEEALAEAVAIARGLGAAPLERRVTARMRDLRIRVPRGPREETRANPAGLTARQLEVLELLARGPHERRDRRPPGRLPAHRRAPRGGGAGEARGDDAARGRASGRRAPPAAVRVTASGGRRRSRCTPPGSRWRRCRAGRTCARAASGRARAPRGPGPRRRRRPSLSGRTRAGRT